MIYLYHRKEVKKILRDLENIIKELIKLFQQLNKLMIEIITFVGWLLILIKLFT